MLDSSVEHKIYNTLSDDILSPFAAPSKEDLVVVVVTDAFLCLLVFIDVLVGELSGLELE